MIKMRVGLETNENLNKMQPNLTHDDGIRLRVESVEATSEHSMRGK
jgi:hypothetical protein